MPRYACCADHPNIWDDVWFEEEDRPESIQVITEVEAAEDTGLVDALERPIYRLPERRKIGFDTG